MTTTDTASKFRYQGNGSTDTFAFSGRVFSESDIIVEIITRATDALVETLTINTHYTVTIASNGTASVEVTSAPKIPSASQDILLRRSVAQSQSLVLPTGTVFPAKSVETALDRVTVLVQDLEEQVNRSIKLPAQTSATSGLTVEPEDGAILAWDGTTGLLQNGPDIADFADITGAVDDAETAAAAATAAAATATTKAAEAAASAASVSLPALGAANTVLQVNAGGAALEYEKVKALNVDINAATDVVIVASDEIWFSDASDSSLVKKDTVQGILDLVPVASTGFYNGGYRTGAFYYYGIGWEPSGAVGTTPTANILYCRPIVVAASKTFTRISCHVRTLGSGSSARLGIYNWVDGVPTTLVLDAGTVSTASTGVKDITISQALTPGVYGLAFVCNATAPEVYYLTQSGGVAGDIMGNVDFTGSTLTGGLTIAHTFGALPSPFGTPTGTANSTQMPGIGLRIA